MPELDIFAPQVSVVSRDLSGKSILVYGQNRVGKTRNLCKLPKPVTLAFEAGLNAIAGVPFFPMQDWKSYIQFVKQITDPRNLERAKSMYQTIILDEISAMGNLCASYICTKFGVQSLGEKKRTPDGKTDFTFNGYKELDNENQKWMRKLMAAGFTVAYIGHEGSREFQDTNGETYTKIVPKGDKRIVDAICDAVDIIAYAIPNGLDKDGNEIKSSLALANTPRFLAGSRFDYMPPFLKEFSAENLVKAVEQAVIEQEKAEGISAVSFEEQEATKKVEKSLSYEELRAQIENYAMKLYNEETGMDHRYIAIVDEHLGKGAAVSESNPTQIQQLEMILFDLKRLDI